MKMSRYINVPKRETGKSNEYITMDFDLFPDTTVVYLYRVDTGELIKAMIDPEGKDIAEAYLNYISHVNIDIPLVFPDLNKSFPNGPFRKAVVNIYDYFGSDLDADMKGIVDIYRMFSLK